MVDDHHIYQFRELREEIPDDVDEIVRWQMTGILMKKTPVARRRSESLYCQNCGGDWHGLPVNGCLGSHPGSFDTP